MNLSNLNWPFPLVCLFSFLFLFCPEALNLFLPSDLSDSLLSQSLLFVDPHVEQDGLHAQEHPVLDLSWQRVKQHPGHRDPDVKAGSVSCDHRQHVRGKTRSRLGHFKGDISEVHYSDTHILQHGKLLSFRSQAVNTEVLNKSVLTSQEHFLKL